MTAGPRLRRAIGLGLLALGGAPAPAIAQLGGAVDVAAGAVAPDPHAGTTALTVAPSLRYTDPALELEAGGVFSRFRERGWGAQGLLRVSPPPIGGLGLRPELTAAWAGGADASSPAARRWDLVARLHAGRRAVGGWLGAGLGRAAVDGSAHPLGRFELGGWGRVGPGTVQVWMVRTGLPDSVLRSGAFWSRDPGLGDTLFRRFVTDYTDVGSRLMLALGRVELDAALTRRIGLPELETTSWHLGGTVWVRPEVGVIASAGRASPDLTLAPPGTRYATLGLRFALGAGVRPPSGIVSAPAAAARLALGDGGRLRLVAPHAREVMVMGDFTDWQPAPLEPAGGGRWEYPEPLAPGVHQLNVRIDAGPWTVPLGATPVDDGFGGRTGLFVVR